MNDEKALNSRRNQIEKDLHFEGFFILENKLKPITTQIISRLLDANINCVMVTGNFLLFFIIFYYFLLFFIIFY